MEPLPNELLHHVFSYLDTTSLARCEVVDRRSRDVLADEVFWKAWFQAREECWKQKYGLQDLEKPEGVSWKAWCRLFAPPTLTPNPAAKNPFAQHAFWVRVTNWLTQFGVSIHFLSLTIGFTGLYFYGLTRLGTRAVNWEARLFRLSLESPPRLFLAQRWTVSLICAGVSCLLFVLGMAQWRPWLANSGFKAVGLQTFLYLIWPELNKKTAITAAATWGFGFCTALMAGAGSSCADRLPHWDGSLRESSPKVIAEAAKNNLIPIADARFALVKRPVSKAIGEADHIARARFNSIADAVAKRLDATNYWW